MRVAIGQLWQETNTFNPQPTVRADFELFGALRGQAVVREMAEVNELGGVIQTLRRWPENPELVGAVRLPAWPAGAATAETFDWLADELIGQVRRAAPVDAVVLALHGSMAADEHPDVEGEMLARVRELIGPRTPLVASLDLHANLTEAMVENVDAFAVYHCAPHVDVFETGERAARILRRIIDGARPVTALQKIPCVLPPELGNTEAEAGVSVDLKRRLKQMEAEPQVLSAAIATVQPWLDIPELGSAALVVTDDDPAGAQQRCAELAGTLWKRKSEYLPETVSIEDAVRRAHETEGLAVLSDAADATTSGAPGDSVWMLKEMARYDWPRPALLTLLAPQVVEIAREIGEGASRVFSLGGVLDTRFGTNIDLELTVERLFEASFVMSGHIGRNMPIDMGSSAVLRRGEIRIVATSRSGPHFAPELFQRAGLDPFAAAVVIAKSPCGFRAVYEHRAELVLNVQSPGCAPTDFWNYDFHKIPRPLWPWDEIDGWRPAPSVYRSSV